MTCPHEQPRVQCPEQRRAERAERWAKRYRAGEVHSECDYQTECTNRDRDVAVLLTKLDRAHATLRRQGELLRDFRDTDEAAEALLAANVELEATVERLRADHEDDLQRAQAAYHVDWQRVHTLLRAALPIIAAAAAIDTEWCCADCRAERNGSPRQNALAEAIDAAPPALLEMARALPRQAELHGPGNDAEPGDGNEPQPCGHPRSAIVSSDEGTSYCAECEREARAALTSEQPSVTEYRSGRVECDGCGAVLQRGEGDDAEPEPCRCADARGGAEPQRCGTCAHFRSSYAAACRCRDALECCDDYKPRPAGEGE